MPLLNALQFESHGATSYHGASQIPSVDAAMAKYCQIFKDTPTAIKDLKEVEVLLPKTARGEKGSTEYRKNMAVATASMDQEFGVAIYHIDTRSDAEDGNQTQHQYIQERIVDNLTKLDEAAKRGLQFDMMDVLMVPTTIANPTASIACDMFGFEQVNPFTDWNKLDWNVIATWQWALNTSRQDVDKVSSVWFKDFLEKFCTTTLRSQLNTFYDKLPLHFKGAATYAYLLCQELSPLNRDTTTALKNFLKLCSTKGLRRIKGENVSIYKQEVEAVVRRLNEANALPEETVIDILTGLTLCSVEDFKRLFNSYLDDVKKASLASTFGRTKTQDTFGQVMFYLNNAAIHYRNLNMSNKWIVGNSRGCFNNFTDRARGPGGCGNNC